MATGVVLRYEVFGDEQINREMLRFEGRLTDARPAFLTIIDDMQDQIEQQFESQGVSGSGGWTPLKPETIAEKEAKGYDTRILHRTHRLRESLTDPLSAFSAGNPDQVLVLTPMSFEFGSTVPYGAVHQKGSEIANIPQRRPVEFSEVQRQGHVRTLQRFIIEGDLGVGGLV